MEVVIRMVVGLLEAQVGKQDGAPEGRQRRRRAQGRRHEPSAEPVRFHVIKDAPLSIPYRLAAARIGYLNATAGPVERANVNLAPPGLVALVTPAISRPD